MEETKNSTPPEKKWWEKYLDKKYWKFYAIGIGVVALAATLIVLLATGVIGGHSQGGRSACRYSKNADTGLYFYGCFSCRGDRGKRPQKISA